MSRRNVMRLTRCGAVILIIAGAIYLAMGCGLGYIDPSDLPSSVYVRIENGTSSYLVVTLSTPDPPATPTGDADLSSPSSGDDDAPLTSRLRGSHAAGGKSALLAKQAVVRVAPGASTSGSVECVSGLTVKAQIEGEDTEPVVLTGVGAGTSGFDSGSVGLDGERLLTPGVDFDCSDRLLIRISSARSGQIVAVPAGAVLPEPITPPDTDDGSGGTDGGDASASETTVAFQLQNMTSVSVEFSIAAVTSDAASEATVIRLPARQLTSGTLPCGPTWRVSGVLADPRNARPVTLTGDGTGTIGFDEGSIGASGERYLVFEGHYACGGTIVLTLTDDGSAVGSSTSTTPLGEVAVFSSGQPPPPVNLNDNTDGGGSRVVHVRVNNETESFVQVTLIAGSAEELNATSLDVRVPPFRSTLGTASCAQRYTIRAAHLESANSRDGVGFHTVVLTGAGGGLEGFDENSVGTDNSRLLLLDTHFECDQTLTITIRATNNTVDPETGDTDYGIGDGDVTVGVTQASSL